MLYTQAVIHETQRLANILRINVSRKTHKPTILAVSCNYRKLLTPFSFEGQTIPENTSIHADIHYVLWNDPLFVNPKEFRPERYITDDGRNLRKVRRQQIYPILCPNLFPFMIIFFSGTGRSHHCLLSWQTSVCRRVLGQSGTISCSYCNSSELPYPAHARSNYRSHSTAEINWPSNWTEPADRIRYLTWIVINKVLF